ncbi:hypothetical protein NDU88_008786 [Pleurodeles waltl]|uniref:Uncharacterized protein n=1 Tax=Pleurodeles waltl TaxID=8319 RepID=A0AAV7PQB8_PLEWA|nr:hypothetical protein NDU88_008786 [Pleurodeles waltl]
MQVRLAPMRHTTPEAIALPKPMVSQMIPPCSATPPADPRLVDATESILQEITAVGRHLEAIGSKISDLSTASTSIRANIARFQVTVKDLDHHLMTVKTGLRPCQNWTRRCSSFGHKLRTWRTGVGGTMSVFLAYRNTRKAQMSKPSLKTS